MNAAMRRKLDRAEKDANVSALLSELAASQRREEDLRKQLQGQLALARGYLKTAANDGRASQELRKQFDALRITTQEQRTTIKRMSEEIHDLKRRLGWVRKPEMRCVDLSGSNGGTVAEPTPNAEPAESGTTTTDPVAVMEAVKG